MQVKEFHLGPMMTNCFLAWQEDKIAYLFDCGGENLEALVSFVKEKGLDLQYMVLTHGHGDHIAGLDTFFKYFPNAKLYIGEEEKAFLEDANLNLNSYITGKEFHYSGDYQTLRGGDRVGAFLVIDTPGHTIGSKSYYHEPSHTLFSGDTLFYHSYGRCDLPTGNERQLLESLRKLCRLPEETKVYSAHTESTSIGEEKRFLGL